jgi:hypothetical protein
MRDSTRTRKQDEASGARHRAVAPLRTSPEHLRACKLASRSHALTIYPLAETSLRELRCEAHGWSAASQWTGSAQRAGRKLTGDTHIEWCPQCGQAPVEARGRSTAYDLSGAYPAERDRLRRQFAQTVHLRGQSGADYNRMTGQTHAPVSKYPEPELAFGCVAQVPSDERYSEKMLIRTRKGRKLVQRPAKQRQIEIESAHQVAQAGPLFAERAAAMHLEGQHSESERITIDAPDRTQPRIQVSETLARITDGPLAALVSQSVYDQRALSHGAALAQRPHAGRPLDVPERADSSIPSGREDTREFNR